MRGTGGLQKILYLIMLVLGAYILYKSGCILLDSAVAQRALDAGEVQRNMEDAAMRTYAPGYTAAVEGQGMPNWLAEWMRQVVPVYSYLAEGQAGENAGAAQEDANAGQAGQRLEPQTEKVSANAGQGVGQRPGAQTESWIERPDTEQTKAAVKDGTDEIGESGRVNKAGKATESGEADEEGRITEANKTSESDKAAESDQTTESDLPAASRAVVSKQLLTQLSDFDYLLSHYYTVDEGTMADAQLLDANVLLQTDMRLVRDPSVPQILIYHTHSQEAFADSREGETQDTIIGMGEMLAEELRNTYGYQVIHDTGVYDLVDGVIDRSAAYDYARGAVEQILQEHPTIEVIIDLHRDGVEGEKFVTEIDGKPTSMIMFFNGISRDSADQPLSWLQNPYTQDNLAFSLQLQLAAEELYPGFTRNIYLKAERFNLHLRPRSLLVEAGTQLNTVEEEQNAMGPLAALLDHVLSGS